jgi:hypothetical protein
MSFWRTSACLLSWILLSTLSGCGFQNSLSAEELSRVYERPVAPPDKPLRVFHLGHSLVNRDMPFMLEQMAGAGHEHRSQLGWGASLKSHWEPDVPINGFKEENAHPRYQDAMEAVRSGRFDAIVVTEMVEIRSAIKYFEAPKYLRLWTREARRTKADARVYLYETWHRLDDEEGWLERLDKDLSRYWEGELLSKALAEEDAGGPIHVIPAGQVLAEFVRRIEQQREAGSLKSRNELFARNPDGSLDNIHLNDLGNYLVALTHYAVLYHRSPVGMPIRLKRANGTDADAPDAATARLMQEVTWEVVTGYPKTGVAQTR